MTNLTSRSLMLILVALVLGAAAPRPALAAGSWRCGSRLIGEGNTIHDVYARCGEPTDREASFELVTFKVSRDVAVTREVPIEHWTYNVGPKQFVRFLTFEDGTLVRIDEGSYGY